MGTENRETGMTDDTMAEQDEARSKKSKERSELSARRYIREKLKSIIVPKIAFEDTSLEEAIDFLRLRMRELDPDPDPVMRGVSLNVRKQTLPEGEFVMGTEMDLRIRDLKMENTSAWDLLHLVAREFRMNVEITDTGIELVPP